MMLGLRIVTCCVVTAVTMSCGSIKDIMTLQMELSREFKTRAISIDLNNNRYLTVTFQNSPFANLPTMERQARARDVAVFVRDHYPGYTHLERVSVGFAIQRKAGMLTVTQSEVPYTFTTTDLGQPQHVDSTETKPVKAVT